MEIEEHPSSADAEARELVRSFSDKLKTKDEAPTDLEEALSRGVEDYDSHSRKRRQVFQSSAHSGRSFDRANRECESVQSAWAAFLSELNGEGENKTKTPWKNHNKSARVDADLKDLEVSTIDDVLLELDKVQKSWVEKDRLLGGKCQEHFHRACIALSEHDIIFDMIPNQNNYAATLCGSMRMLIRASSNHVKYAEELGRALSEISDEIGQANLLLAVMNVPEMERRVEELYVKIFHMFQRAMSWYQSSAFRKIRFGLNEGLYDNLKGDVLAIKDHALSIQRDAVARGMVENREVRLIAESTAIDSRETRLITEATYSRLSESQQTQDATFLHVYQMRQQMAQMREEQQRDNAKLTALLTETGRRLANGLADQALQLLLDKSFFERRASQSAVAGRDGRRVDLEQSLSRSPSPSRYVQHEGFTLSRSRQLIPYYKDDLMEASEHLDSHITGRDEQDLALRRAPSLATTAVTSKLQAWSRSSQSQRLWIFGPPNYGVPSALVGAALSVLKTSQFLEIPVVAHSCDRGRATSKFISREEEGVIGLVYSMIRQLVAAYPDGLQTHFDLSAKRFQKLDGTLDSWQDALSILADLIACAPPLLLFLIDGLNRVEGGNAISMCEDVLDVLDTCTNPDPDHTRVVKLLFTSSGNCKALRDWLDKQETLMVEDAPPTRQSSNNLGDGTTPLVLRDIYDGTEDDD